MKVLLPQFDNILSGFHNSYFFKMFFWVDFFVGNESDRREVSILDTFINYFQLILILEKLSKLELLSDI